MKPKSILVVAALVWVHGIPSLSMALKQWARRCRVLPRSRTDRSMRHAKAEVTARV